MTIGTRLRQLREKSRLSQQEVADALNIAQSTYSQWESDLTSFKVEYLFKLASLYKTDAAGILSDRQPPVLHNTPETLLFHELLESKNELIKLLKAENDRLRGMA